ncbi:MAG TPA: alpha/beta fold hydrolase [Candidatus Polarisedimenticolaceae bacterium]|nr:alpha/beta fold hydrolase [Candidatus Polarisedimenticolaceae bacterium]
MADVRKLWIEGPAGRLEAALRVSESPRAGAVLAHPHPLYGGTLHNPVVFHADRALNAAGLSTLRFDFRGVEGSDGAHDEGRGEVDDIAAAARWIRGLITGKPLFLVGYSFGAYCAITHALRDPAVAGVVAIGLPARLYDFAPLARLDRPLAVVQGTRDEFGTIEEVEALLAATSPRGRLAPVVGATHLFPGRAADAAARVVEAVEEMLQPSRTSSV